MLDRIPFDQVRSWIRRRPRTAIFSLAAIPASITLALVTGSHDVLKAIYGLGAYIMLVAAFEETS